MTLCIPPANSALPARTRSLLAPTRAGSRSRVTPGSNEDFMFILQELTATMQEITTEQESQREALTQLQGQQESQGEILVRLESLQKQQSKLVKILYRAVVGVSAALFALYIAIFYAKLR